MALPLPLEHPVLEKCLTKESSWKSQESKKTCTPNRKFHEISEVGLDLSSRHGAGPAYEQNAAFREVDEEVERPHNYCRCSLDFLWVFRNFEDCFAVRLLFLLARPLFFCCLNGPVCPEDMTCRQVLRAQSWQTFTGEAQCHRKGKQNEKP